MGIKPVKIGAKLPKEDAFNGLSTVHGDLLEENDEAWVVLRLRHGKLTTHPGGILEPTTVITRIEGLTGDLAVEAERLANRARARRASLEMAADAPSPTIPGLDLPD